MESNRIRSIFVVDDEVVIADTLARILSQNGFQAKAYTNPLIALREAAASSIDLLISNVMMPQLSGIDLAIQMQSLWPYCKVLLFSGQAGTADLLAGARKDGHDFCLLLKPIHPSDLLHEIRAQGADYESALCQ